MAGIEHDWAGRQLYPPPPRLRTLFDEPWHLASQPSAGLTKSPSARRLHGGHQTKSFPGRTIGVVFLLIFFHFPFERQLLFTNLLTSVQGCIRWTTYLYIPVSSWSTSTHDFYFFSFIHLQDVYFRRQSSGYWIHLTMLAWLFHEHAIVISTNICKNEIIKERTCPDLFNCIATEFNWPCVEFVNSFNIFVLCSLVLYCRL
jgi:hypothetical protein